MKALNAAALAHIAGEVHTLAMCWKLTRPDGVVMGFTNHQTDLVVSGLTYKASTGMVRATAIAGTSDLSVDNTDVQTVLDSDAIDREDVLAGRYDYAEVRIFLVNYLDPASFDIKLLRGRLGEVSVGKHVAQAELRSLTQQLKQRVGRTHESSCPYDLGDEKCGVNLASFTDTGTISQVISQHRFKVPGLGRPDDWFNGGQVTFTSGNNITLSMSVGEFIGSTGEFFLSMDMPFLLQVGDDISVIAGCDKLFATCTGKFSNENFGGFPHIPGTDWMLSFPNNRAAS